jgi:hypothetical protein
VKYQVKVGNQTRIQEWIYPRMPFSDVDSPLGIQVLFLIDNKLIRRFEPKEITVTQFNNFIKNYCLDSIRRKKLEAV